MKKVLVAAATKYGATGEIAEAIGDVLAERGLDATVIRPSRSARSRTTTRSFSAARCMRATGSTTRRSWLTGPVMRSPPGPCGSSRAVRSAILRGRWSRRWGRIRSMSLRYSTRRRPREHRVFAGKLEKKNLSFPERAILIAFRGMEGDFRDWTEIKAWASRIADSLQPGS